MAANVRDTSTYELADVGSRLGALIIDSIILGIIGGILFGATRNGGAGGVATFAVGVVYNWYFWTRFNGQTPGKSIMQIRVVKLDGSRLEDGDAVMRYIGYYVNSLFFGIGWLWSLFDSKHQGWHDKMVNTVVVRAEKPKRKHDFV
jgi:uncharacterized RDD family membrane protein YckC